MDNWDIIEILKVGLPGLVFLLSAFSYRLLAREQGKSRPNHDMLESIKHYMYINVLLAILTAMSPLIGNGRPQPLGNSLQIERIELLEAPQSNRNLEKLKHKHPAVYSESDTRIMFVAKVSGFQFNQNKAIRIRYSTQIEEKDTKKIVKSTPEFERTDPAEWLGGIKALGLSRDAVENIVGKVPDTSTALSDMLVLDEKLHKGDYIIRFKVRDEVAGSEVTSLFPFYVEQKESNKEN